MGNIRRWEIRQVQCLKLTKICSWLVGQIDSPISRWGIFSPYKLLFNLAISCWLFYHIWKTSQNLFPQSLFYLRWLWGTRTILEYAGLAILKYIWQMRYGEHLYSQSRGIKPLSLQNPGSVRTHKNFLLQVYAKDWNESRQWQEFTPVTLWPKQMLLIYADKTIC